MAVCMWMQAKARDSANSSWIQTRGLWNAIHEWYSLFTVNCSLTSSCLHQYVSIICPGKHCLTLSGSNTLNNMGPWHGGGEKEGCHGRVHGSTIASAKIRRLPCSHPSLNPCKMRFIIYAHGSENTFICWVKEYGIYAFDQCQTFCASVSIQIDIWFHYIHSEWHRLR